MNIKGNGSNWTVVNNDFYGIAIRHYYAFTGSSLSGSIPNKVMAFSTSDIEGDVALLEQHGIEMISPITPCCSGPDSWGGIVAFADPDGTVMELVEQPMMTVMSWFM